MGIKEKLVLALDVEDIKEAKDLVDELSPYIGTFKVGLQLFCGYGLEIIDYIKQTFYLLYQQSHYNFLVKGQYYQTFLSFCSLDQLFLIHKIVKSSFFLHHLIKDLILKIFDYF